MKCAQCGGQLENGMRFCAQCGAPVTPPVGQQPKRNSSTIIIGVCIAVIVIAIGTLIALFALGAIGGSHSGNAASPAVTTSASAAATSSASALSTTSAQAKSTDNQKSNAAVTANDTEALDNEGAFIGRWKLGRIMDTGAEGYWEDIREYSKKGYTIELTLKDDETFAMSFGSGTVRGSWEATEPDKGSIHFPGDTESMRIRDEKLVIEHGSSKMEFQKM